MNQSSFWHDRRVLVLGCTGFLGTWVVRTLLEHGATVSGLVRNPHRRSEFFQTRLFDKIDIARGSAIPERLRSLLAVHQPSVVFQLVTVPGEAHRKTIITADLLNAVAEQSPDTAVVAPVSATERDPVFQNRAQQLRVGFVKLPSLFGDGDFVESRWQARLFRAAAQRRSLPQPTDGEAKLSHVAEAAKSLLGAAELLSSLPEAMPQGLRLEPPATTTARQLFERVTTPLGLAGDRVGGAVRDTLSWYERQFAARDTDVSAVRAA
ncbi:NAD-dependent epimerase/dehydratase family protein [Limnoglobus roseus]|uniref:NAD(P)-dependent oxidoreductase n=1 Tax=Limnoglobus roseus TaxID=2598579 RepID=A0A5C1AK59_9BACT|nr:NAD-dependent epimerase/dehydratase family protein [Limnoglobus roseus]QEL19779.1 NAD(P)-dependent oxidoreductase [Limnoglobus roseus]